MSPITMPRRLAVRGQMKWLAGLLVAVFVAITGFLIYLAVVGDPASKRADQGREFFQLAAALSGGFAIGLGILARRTLTTAVVVREDGLQFERGGEGEGRLIVWGQIDRLRFRRVRGELELLDRSGEALGAVSYQLEELGALIALLLARTSVLGGASTLPAVFRRPRSGMKRALTVVAVLGMSMMGYCLWREDGAVLGLALIGFVAVALVLDFLSSIREIVVDRDGLITLKGARRTQTPWGLVDGAALVPVQGPKGQVRIEPAIKLKTGKWRMLHVWGQDPLPVLAAIRAVDPALLIDGPERLIQAGSAMSTDLVEAKRGVGGFFQQLR